MDFLQFIFYMKEQVSLKLQKQVELKSVLKNNAKRYYGLFIQDSSSNMSPIIYLESFYNEYLQETSLEKIVEEIIKTYKERLLSENMDIPSFLDYEKVKGKIIYKLINADANKELLQTVPHEKVLNLAKIFYVMLSNNGKESQSVMIQNAYLDLWKVTKEEISQAAEENTERLFPVKIENLKDILARLVCYGICSKEEETKILDSLVEEDIRYDLYVLSNQSMMNGAAAMLYSNILKLFADKIESDLIILPCSIHEILLMPYIDVDMDSYKEMVKAVNRTELTQEEILSDCVYIYRRETDNIEIA